MNISPAKERTENENALLDKDGFPLCAMTLEEFIIHLRETFGHEDHRIIAFKVRSYGGHSTLTSRRGQMTTIRATKAEIEACKRSLK